MLPIKPKLGCEASDFGVKLSMEFIETSIYSKLIDELLDDDEQRRLLNLLRRNPKGGSVIQGTGGIRKLRFAQKIKAKGTRSGIRVIYYLDLPQTTYLLLAYAKNRRDDLTSEEKKSLKRLVQHLKEN
jgi:hypothetical protein